MDMSSPEEHGILLEGYLLKQGSRSRNRWHDRYFSFHSDNTLRYFTTKDESKPKAVLQLSVLQDVQVSEMFVDRHSKKLIYCVRLSWSSVSSGASSSEADNYCEGSEQQVLAWADSESLAESETGPPTPSSKSRRFSRNLGLSRSVDEEDISIVTNLERRASEKRSKKKDAAPVPSLVEVDDRLGLQAPTSSRQEQARASKTPYEKQRDEEQSYLKSEYVTAKRQSKKRSQQKIVQRTKIVAAAGATVGVAVATAGIGLAVGLILLSAAVAGGGSAAVGSFGKKKEGELVIACADYETAKTWKSCFDVAVESAMVKRSKWGQLFTADGRAGRLSLLPKSRSRDGESNSGSPGCRTVMFESSSKWNSLEGGWAAFLGTGVQGLRIFREEIQVSKGRVRPTKTPGSIVTDVSLDGKPCAPVKAHVVLSASALNAFLCVMSYGCASPSMDHFPDACFDVSEQRNSFRIIETIDDSADVIHLVTRPLFLFPSATAPRDFVLYRCWRLEPDGKYVICYESVEHKECPPIPNCVRGEMHQVITISPHKKRLRMRSNTVVPNECLICAVAQVDPRGWIPTMPVALLSNQSYADAFGISNLLHLLEIRDAIDFDRFEPNQTWKNHQLQTTSTGGIAHAVSSDSVEDTVLPDDFVDYDYTYACHEVDIVQTITGLENTPRPLDTEKWTIPDSNSFRVRGMHYKEDKKKYNAGPSIGRLVAVDVVSVDKPIYSGFTVHPTERMQLALRKEALLMAQSIESDMPPFFFVVNIVLPGPPVHHALFYYAVDNRSSIDGTDGTPSSKLCNEFFFGQSDAFRDRTFKLIPQIVQGNFIVRKAVGSTPAIMGKKLRQLYIRSDRFFEVVLDCGSSPVASGIIRISLGYARTLVVDMAFLFEADDQSFLPERIFGCVRVKNMEFGPNLRFVQCPPDEE
jgi:hypothetical protein